ncbi:MAG: glycosyltransferase family 4 protein [Candidatus Omnitrophica bacterium]|nr:glycosyltransferase family 4 protein [Candidatus Omnitrophota bacterium]
MMLNLVAGQRERGDEAFVIVINNAHKPNLDVFEAVKKAGLHCEVVTSKGRFDLGVVTAVVKILKEKGADILHTHNYKSNLLGLLSAKKIGVPVVATLHGYIGNSAKLRFYEALDRGILKFFNRVVLVDKSLERWFLNNDVKKVVINNGVEINEADLEPKIDKKEIIVGTVGRLSQEKGHKYLIEAFAEFNKKYSQGRLLIVGGGELNESLKSQVSSLKIKDKVVFAGFQSEVKPFYENMDIYVSSSLVEHFPLSILEAMSFGKAIIATDAGGTKELIKDRTTGILIKQGDSEAILNSLLLLAGDVDLRSILGENARKFVKENYSLEKMAQAYKKVYEEVLSGER